MLPFIKVEGLGNHFVLVDERAVGPRDWPAVAREVCPRGTAVGADGLLATAEPSDPSATVRMRMFNPDGSEDMCGNGLRCVALVEAERRGIRSGREFIVETLAGLRSASVTDAGEGTTTVRTSLGLPVLRPSEFPALVEGESALERLLAVAGEELVVSLVSMGTPHCVIFGDPPDERRFADLSPKIEVSHLFPAGISIMWATVEGCCGLRMRIWERAVGETEACGTGACAAAVAGVLTGRVRVPVAVSMPGGTLAVDWAGPGTEVMQSGPARKVFSAEWIVCH
jgi:diaminopimelate epimerase